ncbi:MAG: TonB-dependent receptor, partial [Mucinivorans sp.]
AGGGSVSLADGESNQDQSMNAQSNAAKAITFVVKDAKGQPVVGAMAKVKGTTNAKLVNADGSVTIQAKAGDVIQISFLGFKTLEVPVTSQTNYTATLLEDAIALDEVVVVGFGSQKKVTLTGSVSVVKADDLKNRPVVNVTQALQGMVPGLNISPGGRGGSLDAGMNINIRGGGTIGAGSNSSPLVIIDGMEGDLNSLNPKDIETMSILKDASSSAIYGSRAPFGVILITTKSGKTGRVNVTYSDNFRWSTPMGIPTMMDSETFAEYINLSNINKGGTAFIGEEQLQKIRDHKNGLLNTETGPQGNGKNWEWQGGSWGNNDWYKIMYKDFQFSHEHNLAIDGGSERVQFYVSANYMDQGGLLRYGNDDLKRMGFNAKINVNIAKWATFTSSTKFVRENYDAAAYADNQQLYHEVARQWPTQALYTPEYTSPSGQVIPKQIAPGNYIRYLEDGGRYGKITDRLYQQFKVVLTPVKGWTINAEANMRITNQDSQRATLEAFYFNPDGSLGPAEGARSGSSLSHGQWREDYLNPNIYTDYTKQFDNGHFFKIMVGFQSEVALPRNFSGSGKNLISNNVPYLNLAPDSQSTSATYDQWATVGAFARVNYNYKERYLLEAAIRLDGSSRFSREKRWNWFPSVSAAWNIANESFMESARDVVSTLKIRGSYGQLGNQNTNDLYPFYPRMPIGTSKGNHWIMNGAIPTTYSNAPGLVSSGLTWETVESYDIALDFALFNNRLTGSVGYYNRVTRNMIGPAPALPAVLGVGVPRANNADMRNSGWELEMGWRDRTKSGFSYGVHFNVSDNTGRVLRYPNEHPAWNEWYGGKEMGLQYGFTSIGIAQTKAEMDAHLAKVDQSQLGSNWGAGDMMYADLDGNGKIDSGTGLLGDTGDWQAIGNSSPHYAYGINVDLAYKGFDLSFFLQGVGKAQYVIPPNTNIMFGTSGVAPWQLSGFTSHLDFWRPADDKGFFGPNPNAYFPRVLSDDKKNIREQTRFMQDASYVRMKNIQIGYTLPEVLTQKFYCK